MDLSFLSDEINRALDNIDKNLIYEIRLRKDFPIKINIKGIIGYLSTDGATFFKEEAIICTEKLIQDIIRSLTENSIYAFNDYIKQGYIPTKSGIRVGIAGECVFNDGNIATIKNFTSLNIRIPHEVLGASNVICEKILNGNDIRNSLIISPPFCGKTTILKDLARKINKTFTKNILIIDERGEFSCINGENIDIIKYSNKSFAFDYALRSLSPEIVITDELSSENDWKFVKKAINGGVRIIASVHSYDINTLMNIRGFEKGIFERYFVFDKSKGFGNLRSCFDESFNII